MTTTVPVAATRPGTLALAASWTAQLAAAGILLQTLFFKFTGAPESVFIFSTLGVEPWGRYLTGSMELVASILLLVPGAAPAGALLALGLMGGALMSHLTKLGIAVQDDGGLLFGLAIAVATCSLAVLVLRRAQAWRLLDRARSHLGIQP